MRDIVDVEFVRTLLQEENRTLEEVAVILQQRFPGIRGYNLRSLKRFCQENNIRKRNNVSDVDLDAAVTNAIGEVSHARCSIP